MPRDTSAYLSQIKSREHGYFVEHQENSLLRTTLRRPMHRQVVFSPGSPD